MDGDNLIYGLIDPRTRLIRYVGLSSTGLRRPKQHRRRSAPDTYCRRWVRSLQRLGLNYEITVLETVGDVTELAEAERWWIAFGRACGWPLTNVTDGGGPSAEAIAEMRRRRAELDAANAPSYPASHVEAVRRRLGVPAEIERQCLSFLDGSRTRRRGYKETIKELAAAVSVTRATAMQIYEKWLRLNAASVGDEHLDGRQEFGDCCFRLFENGHGSEAVASMLHADVKVVREFQMEWWRAEDKRKRRAAEEEDERKRRAVKEARETLERRCFKLFEERKRLHEVAVEVGQTIETISEIHKQWAHISYERGKRALAADREAMYQRLANERRRRAASARQKTEKT